MEWSSSNNIHNVDCAATSSSYSTSGTQSQSQSQSQHRRRRGGAAKGRLAKAKEAAACNPKSHKHGWHESMEAASIAAGREWEPEKGWQNYKGPTSSSLNEGELDSLTSDNKLRIPLHVAAKVKKGSKSKHHSRQKETTGRSSDFQEDDGREDPSVSFSQATTITATTHRPEIIDNEPVVQEKGQEQDASVNSSSPVPPQIHRICRSQAPPKNMTMYTKTTSTAPGEPPQQQQQQQQQSQQQRYPNNNNSYTIPTDEAEPRQHIFRPSSSPSSIKSNRWVDSMERATASLATYGHFWDPRHGFTTLDTSDVMSIRSAVPVPVPVPISVSDTVNFNDTRHIPIYKGSPTPSKRSFTDPPGKSAMEMTLDAVMNEEEESEEEGVEIEASSFLRKINDALESQDGTASVLNYEEDGDYIIPSPMDIPFSIVKKEKVRRQDYGMFRNSPQRSLDGSTGRLPLMTKSNGRTANQISPDKPESTSREGRGMPNATANGNRPSRPSEKDFLYDSHENELPRPLKGRSPEPGPKPEPEPEQHEEHEAARHDNNTGDARVGQEQGRPAAQLQSESDEETSNSSGDEESSFDAKSKYLRATRRSVEDKKDTLPPPKDVNSRNPCEVTSSPWACLSSPDTDPTVLKAKTYRTNELEVTSFRRNHEPPSTDMDSIDASQISTTSSATAGWKTFLAKKVRAENEAAEFRQRDQPALMQEKPNKEETIKKTVSFASDSLKLSDSLVDSLFEFGDGGSPDSATRKSAAANREKVFRSPRGSPRSNSSWKESRARLAAAQYRDRILPIDEVKEPRATVPSQRGSGQAVSTQRLSQRPIASRSLDTSFDTTFDTSFEWLMDGKPSMTTTSPTNPTRATATITTNAGTTATTNTGTTTKESLEADDQTYNEPTFLQRLAECKSGHSCSVQKRNNNERGTGISSQWYQQSKQASRLVEEMISSLRSQGQNSGCTSRRGSSHSDSPTTREFGGMESHPNANGAVSRDSAESDAHDLARARVDALVENLYYSSPSSPSQKIAF